VAEDNRRKGDPRGPGAARVAQPLGWGFTLYALPELCYLTYHLETTCSLFDNWLVRGAPVGALITQANSRRPN